MLVSDICGRGMIKQIPVCGAQAVCFVFVLCVALGYPCGTCAQEIKGTVKVTVQADKPKAFLAPRSLGVSWDMAGNEIQEPLLPPILASSGVTTLRYPGSRSADTYHWSTNNNTGPGSTEKSINDFGRFA